MERVKVADAEPLEVRSATLDRAERLLRSLHAPAPADRFARAGADLARLWAHTLAELEQERAARRELVRLVAAENRGRRKAERAAQASMREAAALREQLAKYRRLWD